MSLVHLYCKATDQHTWQPAKSVGLWGNHGWAAVSDEPEPDEDPAAEAETTSRGKSSARTQKDK